MRRRNFSKNQKGVTIVEAMMTVGLIGFVMALVASLAYVGVTAWKRQYARLQLERDAQAAIYVLAKNLRQARSGTITISKYNNPLGVTELDFSLISFEPQNWSGVRHYCYVKSIPDASGNVKSRQLVYVEPQPDGLGNTRYPEKVLGSGLFQGFFTFPDLQDPSQVLVNWTFSAQPFKDQAPIYVQTKEIVYARN